VIVEIFVLALASTVRPTSLAAVYALVFHDSRRRLMSAYVVAGLLFTVTFGAIVVGATHGIHLHSGTGKTKGIADIAGGIVALALGVAIWSGRIGAHRDDDVPVTSGGMTSRLDRRLTTRTAVLAGPATHVPGFFYLIALNVIIAHEAALADEAVALVTYNVVWFALPLAALVACIVHPAAARRLVRSVDQWARHHARGILVVASLGASTALVIRGVLTL
jgi:hypothetical protein